MGTLKLCIENGHLDKWGKNATGSSKTICVASTATAVSMTASLTPTSSANRVIAGKSKPPTGGVADAA